MAKENSFYGHSISIVTLGIICLSFFAQTSFAAGRIKFTAVMDKITYNTEEPIDITFILKNEGKEAVYVNKRFFFSSEEASKNQKDVYAAITSPSGQKLAFKFLYESGYPKTDYFTLLEPGQEVKSEYPRNLRGNFELNETGSYTLTAVYQNVFGGELGLEVFKERLNSAPVTFTITKSDQGS